MKKLAIVTTTIVAGVVLLAQASYAAKLQNVMDAVKDVLGTNTGLETKDVNLSQAEKDSIKEKLGKGALVFSKYKLYTLKDKGAIEVTQPGKWGDTKFLVGIEGKTSKVLGVVVTESSEKRGQAITAVSFLGQFVGKTLSDPIQLDKDIKGVSGATVTSKAAINAVKVAINVYGIATK